MDDRMSDWFVLAEVIFKDLYPGQEPSFRFLYFPLTTHSFSEYLLYFQVL